MQILFVHSWLILLYIAVRLWGLTDACLWFDEIFSIHAAEHGWGDIFNFVALDLIHPPLFYVLLKLWIAVGGEGLLWLRLFPVVWSVLAVFPFLRLCNELKIGRWKRLLALFLLAVNGSLIKYSQEVRMYAPLMCLSLFSMWLFARYFVKGKSFVPLVIVNVLMIYTHYFGWFVIVTEVLLIVWFQRIKWRRMAVMFGVAAGAFLPWLIAVISVSRSGSGLSENIGWMSRPDIREIAIFVLNVVEPFYYRSSTAEPQSQLVISIPILAVISAIAVVCVARWQSLDDDGRTRLWFLFLLIKLPVIAAFAASWMLPYSVWGTRHLIIVMAPFWLAVAVMAGRLKPDLLRRTLIGALIAISALGFVNAGRRSEVGQPWCACETLVRGISSDDTSNIYTISDLNAYQAWFVTRDGGRRVFKLEMPDVAEDRAFFLPRGFNTVERVAFTEITDRRFWIIFGEDIGAQTPEDALERSGYRVTRIRSVHDHAVSTVLALVEKEQPQAPDHGQ